MNYNERMPPRAHSLGLPSRDVAWRSLPDLPALSTMDSQLLNMLGAQHASDASGQLSLSSTLYGGSSLQLPGHNIYGSPTMQRRSVPSSLSHGRLGSIADPQLNHMSLLSPSLPFPTSEASSLSLPTSPQSSYADLTSVQQFQQLQQLQALLSPQMLSVPGPGVQASNTHPYALGPRRRSSPGVRTAASPSQQRRATAGGAGVVKISDRIAEQKRRQLVHEAEFAKALALTSPSTPGSKTQLCIGGMDDDRLLAPFSATMDSFTSSPSLTISQPDLTYTEFSPSPSRDTSLILLDELDQPPPLGISQLARFEGVLSQSDISIMIAQMQLEQSAATGADQSYSVLNQNYQLSTVAESLGKESGDLEIRTADELELTSAEIDELLQQLASG